MNQIITFPVKEIEAKLKHTPFKLRTNTVYYANFSKNIGNFILSGEEIKIDEIAINQFKEKNFDYVSLVETVQIDKLLKTAQYYFPFIDFSLFNDKNVSLSNNLISILGLEISFANALFYLDYNNLYLFDIETKQDIEDFLVQLPAYKDELLYFQPIGLEDEDEDDKPLYSPIIRDDWDSDLNINLDDETSAIVNEIANQLQQLNKTGQFLAILTFIENQINQYKNQIDLPLSYLYIDDDFRIYLKDYQNREIKLSHLTKSLYFLFLMKGSIRLDDLMSYKNELFTIYKHISNQENLDKMEESIDKLVRNENNEIFVHFSRIKSAFCKEIDKQIALKYYIRGGKNQPKSIFLSKINTNIYTLQEICFPNSKRFSTYWQDATDIANQDEALNL